MGLGPSLHREPRAARRARASLQRPPALSTAMRSPSDPLRAKLGPVVPLARVGVLVEVGHAGIRAVVGELDDIPDLGVYLLPQVLEVLLVRQATLLELVLEGDDRVGLA